MTKEAFLILLGEAYSFPDYYGVNLDAAHEILDDMREEHDSPKLNLQPLIFALLKEATIEEKEGIMRLVKEHFLEDSIDASSESNHSKS